jgi:hypothetical protein
MLACAQKVIHPQQLQHFRGHPRLPRVTLSARVLGRCGLVLAAAGLPVRALSAKAVRTAQQGKLQATVPFAASQQLYQY